MNKIERWRKMHEEAEEAFPKEFISPSTQAGVQPGNGKLWVVGDDDGVDHVDAVSLAHWILSVCEDEVEFKGEG